MLLQKSLAGTILIARRGRGEQEPIQVRVKVVRRTVMERQTVVEQNRIG
jgi:hypothetical protein